MKKRKYKLSKIKKLYLNKDALHNWKHILNLKRNVKILRKTTKNIDEDLLEFLTAFHGVKDYFRAHKEEFSKLISKRYLKSLLRKTPKKIEEKLVYDANMLENTGKEGIRKAKAYGKLCGRKKEETIEYLKEKLKEAKFYTKEGKRIGKKKIALMKKLIELR